MVSELIQRSGPVFVDNERHILFLMATLIGAQILTCPIKRTRVVEDRLLAGAVLL